MKKLITAMIVGGCITVFSAGAAFAETPAADPNTSVSQEVEVNEAILKKQQEVDKYLFEDHAADVEKQGITVTHTAPLSDHVEIGITPYDEAKAEYLYGIFGREQVKVVEGEQAVTFGGSANAEAGGAQEQMTTTAAAPAAETATAGETSVWNTVLYVTGGLLLALAAVLAVRKFRAKRN